MFAFGWYKKRSVQESRSFRKISFYHFNIKAEKSKEDLKMNERFVVFLTISTKKAAKNRTRVTKFQKMQENFAKTLVYFPKMSYNI